MARSVGVYPAVSAARRDRVYLPLTQYGLPNTCITVIALSHFVRLPRQFAGTRPFKLLNGGRHCETKVSCLRKNGKTTQPGLDPYLPTGFLPCLPQHFENRHHELKAVSARLLLSYKILPNSMNKQTLNFSGTIHIQIPIVSASILCPRGKTSGWSKAWLNI